jgi:predicted nucleotidyltransferase
MSDDQAFLNHLADVLFDLPAVEAVALGGSRAYGDPGPDADWDLSIYYRGGFDPEDLRAFGWSGEISPLRGWGGGVFNGGAWLTIDHRRVDIHYRDLDDIDRILRESRVGIFQIEPLMFHIAGIPSYLLLAELAEGTCLRGELRVPQFPIALRDRAARTWRERTEMLFDYAESGHAVKGRVLQAIGLAAEAVTCAAHAVLAAKGQWVTNEKRILALAGLEDVDDLLRERHPSRATEIVRALRDRCAQAMNDAMTG